ncbi:hypothetical protein C0Q70_07376 [Pomacea canaliculata]|uniref:Uncharacterized protein n=1 Tax=Pomacea canaliculata TaxID=400727 RepID=A0A2T7PEY0_POMCA|nr:hypothetical protein C0Q70_07376 [Pomacea canaliculata]
MMRAEARTNEESFRQQNTSREVPPAPSSCVPLLLSPQPSQSTPPLTRRSKSPSGAVKTTRK